MSLVAESGDSCLVVEHGNVNCAAVNYLRNRRLSIENYFLVQLRNHCEYSYIYFFVFCSCS